MKETKSEIKLTEEMINRGFKKLLSEISLLKDVIARMVDDINKVKGFQNVMLDVLEESGIVEKEEFLDASYAEYKRSVVDELNQFVKTYMSDDRNAIEALKVAEELKDYYDSDGKPKAEA
tara:strand:- start:90 stop:449 length:360 start_codon:yes stop_codon:yes gene_type:complete